MLWVERWRRLSRWSERLPWWQQWLVLPPLLPAALVLAAVCLCPRTTLIAVGVLAAVYVPLLGWGVIPWRNDLGIAVGKAYLLLIGVGYLGVLQDLGERLARRRRPGRADD
jgi:hypothetical protein